MRAAFRRFVERAGRDGVNFEHHHGFGMDEFSAALGEMRSQVGTELARIAWRYDLEIDDELGRILPPDDIDEENPTWLVGFDG